MTVAASDQLIWELHPSRDRHLPQIFSDYFDTMLGSGGALIVLEKTNGAAIGWSRYGEYNSDMREIEVGWTFLVRAHWGGDTNREMKALMLSHAFKTADTVSFRIATDNLRSRAAVEKIGGVLTTRAAEIAFAGRSVPHVVYVIGKAEFQASSLRLLAPD